MGFCLQVSIMCSKWKIKGFYRDNDFGLWEVKMQTILTQDKYIEAVKVRHQCIHA